MNRRTIAVSLCIGGLVAALAIAQPGDFFRGRSYRGLPEDRNGVPDWKNDPEFMADTFTFVRIRYSSYGRYGRGGGGWRTDWPDSDLNFSFRLQQLTSLKVNPDPIDLELTDPKLFDYPFIYMIEPGSLAFDEAEIAALRRYLLRGGFLMVDDFWGDQEFNNFHEQIKLVFPDRDLVELEVTHPIFRCVYPLKEKVQIPSIGAAMYGAGQGITYEPGRGRSYDEHGTDAHYKVMNDDKGRMMMIVCHNTDLGDGWEREGEDPWYFKEFSEKKAYPMGINIVFWAMTH